MSQKRSLTPIASPSPGNRSSMFCLVWVTRLLTSVGPQESALRLASVAMHDALQVHVCGSMSTRHSFSWLGDVPSMAGQVAHSPAGGHWAEWTHGFTLLWTRLGSQATGQC